MIKKISLFLLLLFVLKQPVLSQDFGINANTLLWKIKSAHSSGVSYLVLTTPNICNAPVTLLKKVSDALGGIGLN